MTRSIFNTRYGKRYSLGTSLSLAVALLAAMMGIGACDTKPLTQNRAEENGRPSSTGTYMNTTQKTNKEATLVLAGGCFWCVEAVFEQLDGVVDAVSGYAGGTAETANYSVVSTGGTDHAEAVKIVYDPSKITMEALLEVHFATHDPTTMNRQGNDEGPQYRSAIFYANETEKKTAEAYIEKLGRSGKFSKPIVTTIEPLSEFFTAEEYHQNYVVNNPMKPYVQGVAIPKVEKTRKLFGDKLRDTGER